MDWIVVAREFRESDDILIRDRFADRLAHPDREVLEIESLKHQLLHAVQAFVIRSRFSTSDQMDILWRVGFRKALNRDSPDGGFGEAEVAATDGVFQEGVVAVGCGCASERIGSRSRAE